MSNDSDDPQDVAEALDSDKIGTPDDADIEPDYPLDVLLGADEYGITAAEEQIDEPLEERVRRESPEPLASELDRSDEADVADVTAGIAELELDLDDDTLGAIDAIEPLTADEVGAPPSGDEPVGRLVEPGVDDDVRGVDDEAESVAMAYDEADLSAEEAAVHVTDAPPMQA